LTISFPSVQRVAPLFKNLKIGLELLKYRRFAQCCR